MRKSFAISGGRVSERQNGDGNLLVYCNPDEGERQRADRADAHRRPQPAVVDGPRRDLPPRARARPRGPDLQAAQELLRRRPPRLQGLLHGPVLVGRKAHRRRPRGLPGVRGPAVPEGRQRPGRGPAPAAADDPPLSRAPAHDHDDLGFPRAEGQPRDGEPLPAQPLRPGKGPGLLPERSALQPGRDREAQGLRRRASGSTATRSSCSTTSSSRTSSATSRPRSPRTSLPA